MCGRYVYKVRHQVLLRLFPELAGLPFPTLKERWNAAPSQALPIIRRVKPDASALEIIEATWGLIPSWSKEEKPKPGPIIARCETIATNGLFRTPFRMRRCVVPASGFYEWQERMLQPTLPLYVTRADDEPILLAGLWESHRDKDSFSIVTVPPRESTKEIHERAPAILEPEEVRAWFDPATPQERAAALLHPAPDGVLQWHPVSTRVNSPKNDGPELIEQVLA